MSARALPVDPIINAEDLTKVCPLGKQQVHALRGVSLQVQPGEFVCLLGRSGAGKTTVLNLVGGLDRPTSGNLRVAGETLYAANRAMSEGRLDRFRREHLGFIFTEFFLVPTLTATENVMLPSVWTGKADRGRAEALLETVGLGHRLHHLPRQLSGGEMQRVAIARAIINQPALLLADEPTGNLDTRTRDEVFAIFQRLVSEQSITVMLSTHDHELAERIPRVVRLDDGRIVGDERHDV
jgi:putative ABC transport system ATP-binding protein